MRQVVQNFKSGRLGVDDVPAPVLQDGCLLVANYYSLISPGTERATVDLARRSLIGKAQARPDLVRKVVDTLRRDGIGQTVRMVNERLDRLAPLGYSCAGVVIGVGAGVQGFRAGDRVACAGQDHASHADVVCVPANLCTAIPDRVSFADAAFVAVGAVALHGVRQSEPRIGETIAVIGLGLVGQLIAQILRANGCRVIASDVDAARLTLARRLGASYAVTPAELVTTCAAVTVGRGCDAAIVAANTVSNEPVEAAAEICRQKGRVVIVGAVGMDLPREPFYRKELELRLSTSYGPGRYDEAYEERGVDYPYGYVRWTEGRNLAAFLALIADGRIDIGALTSHRFPIDEATRAYELLRSAAPSLGILLSYPDAGTNNAAQPHVLLHESIRTDRVRLGIIGPGNHVRDRLLPALRKNRSAEIHAVCAATGINAKSVATRETAAYCTTNYRELLADSTIDAVIIGTRHDSHAPLVVDALQAGKHIFVEKPLCLNHDELQRIDSAYAEASAVRNTVLAVGLNRRHSPHICRIAEHFVGRSDPLTMIYRVNAARLTADHWIQDATNGGRIVGEVCHFIDVLHALCCAAPTGVQTTSVGRHSSGITNDKVIVTLDFADGSIGTIIYTADGPNSVSKERLELFGDGKAAVLDDFNTTTLHGAGRPRTFRTRRPDKGFAAEMAHFVAAVTSGASGAADFAAVRSSMLATLQAQRSFVQHEPLTIE